MNETNTPKKDLLDRRKHVKINKLTVDTDLFMILRSIAHCEIMGKEKEAIDFLKTLPNDKLELLFNIENERIKKCINDSDCDYMEVTTGGSWRDAHSVLLKTMQIKN